MKSVRARDQLLGAPAMAPGVPLQTQIAAHIRELILSGVLAPGTRLPGRRTLARDLRVSANTILNVTEQLTSEGLVEPRGGSGTYVAAPAGTFRAARRAISGADREDRKLLPLEIGAPALDLFPRKIWSRLQARRWDRLSTLALGEGHPAGWAGLREQIAQRVAAFRGVSCKPEQVIVTAGGQAALALIGRALAQETECAWVEDPGYLRSSETLRHAGLRPIPVPADGEGFDVSRASGEGLVRLAVVTPARQFPTGVVMSEPRRQALIRWARTNNSWIVEDDFESDFCFESRAPRTLTTDAPDRVIYLSSFSPILFPALRIAFIIAPEAILDRLLAVRAASDRMVNTPLQMTLHDFMEGGHLAAHVRRCTSIYAERRAALNEGLMAHLPDDVFAPAIGLHSVVWLKTASDIALSETAYQRGLAVSPMSKQAKLPVRPGLVLGFAAFSPDQIRRAVDILAQLRAESA